MVALPASICQGAAGAGYAGFRADPDGTVRQSAFLVRSGDRAVPSLALAAVAHATGATAQVEEDGSLMLDGEPLPMGANQATLLRFYGDDKGNGSFELLTADDVLEVANEVLDPDRLSALVYFPPKG